MENGVLGPKEIDKSENERKRNGTFSSYKSKKKNKATVATKPTNNIAK